jgi:spore photoproduct lyase
MLIYLEKNLQENERAKHIISCYKNPVILPIDNYKNIFDKNIAWKTEKSIIIAKLNNTLTQVPENYGFSWIWFFFKNSLNCVYDCRYCYLKGALKNNNMQVFFVNYEDMQAQIKEVLEKYKNSQHPVWFYSSDYSDNLATDSISGFSDFFIPFFETLPNARMEIRTKSTNISHLLKHKNIKHTEIAFSLSPQEIIEKYEQKTPSLDMRIQAINTLIKNNWKVGLRFLPLLETKNYQEIYTNFLKYISEKIDFSQINSIFLWGLMYTYEDYNKILQKEKTLDVLYKLEKNEDGFFRESREVRTWFYDTFWKYIGDKNLSICLDKKAD